MRSALFLLLLASPAAAHPVASAHAHSADYWSVGFGLLALAVAGLMAFGRRA